MTQSFVHISFSGIGDEATPARVTGAIEDTAMLNRNGVNTAKKQVFFRPKV